MGIGTHDLELLLRLRKSEYIPKAARVVEVGAQQIEDHVLLDQQIFEDLRIAFGAGDRPSWPAPARTSLTGAPRNGPMSREMWDKLGCFYRAIDIDGTPSAIKLDLNYDSVSTGDKGCFDLVTNYGTTEHVANQLNAFKIIHDLTTVGGVMVHHLPAQGHTNHGLFNYNPKFFWMLCRSNGYRIVYMGLEGSSELFGLSADILEFVDTFERLGSKIEIGTPEIALMVALRKEFDYEYVSALDVPTGTPPASDEVRDRYWTVFSQGVF